jgi:signal transduction histidine kinase
VVESRTVQSAFSEASLSSNEERAIHHPGIVLWCPIRHTQDHLLGVLLLGMRGDLDPYRAQDVQELQRLLEGAALALANSAAYQRQCQAEATIRQLYQHLQQAQDTTAAAIARELHDEIINVNVRLNIEALQKLIDQVRDSAILAELELLLQSEHTEAQALRMICEQLHPTGIDDPLGLAAVLRMQVEKIQANWSGTCRLIIEHAPCPIGAQTQREALRIAREALNNAMQHASATEIIVRLRYPDTAGGMIALSIHDNGSTGQVITIKPGHWGVRNMEERARAVGGMLEFRREPDGGTTVVFVFAAEFATAST